YCLPTSHVLRIFLNVSSSTFSVNDSTSVSETNLPNNWLSLSARRVAYTLSPTFGHTDFNFGKSIHGIKNSRGAPISIYAPSLFTSLTNAKPNLSLLIGGIIGVANSSPRTFGYINAGISVPTLYSSSATERFILIMSPSSVWKIYVEPSISFNVRNCVDPDILFIFSP